MYLSEKKRAEIRKCIGKQKLEPGAKESSSTQAIPNSEDRNQISQILFDARDGKELFTP